MIEEKKTILRQIKTQCAHLRISLVDLALISGVVYERLRAFTLDEHFMLSPSEFALIEKYLDVPECWHLKDAASFSKDDLEMQWCTPVFGKQVPVTTSIFGMGAFEASEDLRGQAFACLYEWLSLTGSLFSRSHDQLQKDCINTNEGNTIRICHPIQTGKKSEMSYLWLLRDGTVMGELFNTKYCLVLGSINISSLCMAA